jgi:hypothetical protein
LIWVVGAPAVQPAGISSRQPTYFWLEPKVGKSSSPNCARPQPLAGGSLRCAKPGPGQNSLRSLRSLHSNKLAEPEGKRAWRHAGRSSVLLGGAEGQPQTANIQAAELSARCLQSASGGPAAGCWAVRLLPLCPAEQRKNAGARAAGATRDLTSGSLSERSEPQANAVSSARPPRSEQRREPRSRRRRGERSACLIFCLLLDQAKRRPAAGTESRLGGAGGEAPLRAAPRKNKP